MSPRRSDIGRSRHAAAVVVLAILVAALPARGGDEVDYSAPYMVVENGELVTKYPAREHEAGGAATAAAADGVAAGDDADRPEATWVIVAAALAVVISFLVYARRRSRTARSGEPE